MPIRREARFYAYRARFGVIINSDCRIFDSDAPQSAHASLAMFTLFAISSAYEMIMITLPRNE